MLDLGPAALLQATALRLPLADESADLIVTSPPYFGLRSYTDQGEHYAGQLGSEPTPAEFLQALWAATAEMKRVLKPGGSIFLNLGDKYSSGGRGYYDDDNMNGGRGGNRPADSMPPKSLLLLPEAYRLGCTGMLAALGGPDPGLNLIARSVIVWDKPNGLPESVKDRVRRSHEDWVHLVKQPRYYSAVDEIREPHAREWGGAPNGGGTYRAMKAPGEKDANLPDALPHPLGKLPGSVWAIPSEPLRVPSELGVDHYAAFPSEWCRRLILGFSPPGICVGCGEGRVPVAQPTGEEGRKPGGRNRYDKPTYAGLADAALKVREILGYACACVPYTDHPGTGGSSGVRYGDVIDTGYPKVGETSPAGGPTSFTNRPKVGGWREYHLGGWTPPPARPAVILDPFCGTGTTVMVARALGRYGVGVDLSSDYLRLARWRVEESPGVQKVRDRTWPPPPGQARRGRLVRAGVADSAQLSWEL